MRSGDPAEPSASLSAAWRHHGARDGFEVLFIRSMDDGGYHCSGEVAAVEGDASWAVRYSVLLDRSWTTRLAHVSTLTVAGDWELRLEADGQGGWHVEGKLAPHLDGCLDIDLEASVFTNALPVHRLRLAIGESADAPAAYVRALEPRVERLEQRYVRLADECERSCYDYAAPDFDFRDVLVYDPLGLILDYPRIAERVA
jgi:hypothetical protein